MAIRRRRSRRSWSSSRLHRRLLQHQNSAVRASLGAALLLGFWLWWPDTSQVAPDQRSRWVQSIDEPTAAEPNLDYGLVAAAQASLVVSIKGQIVGGAVASRERVASRLRQVAETMPDIGIPDPPVVNGAIAAPSELAPADTRSDPSVVAHADPVGVSADAVFVIERAAAAVAPTSSEVTPEAAAIVPAVAPAPSAAHVGQDETTVAHAEVPAALVPAEPADGRTPTWLRNAVATSIDHRPAIALVIDDLGFSRAATTALNRLRAPLTLAFLPYAADLDAQTQAAHAAGHELLIHMPMEPRGQAWPGPDALTSQLGPAELISRLRTHLRSFRGFVGINNHMGSLLTADPERMALVMAELHQRNLLFLDSRTASDTVAAREAARFNVPFAERDVFIDNELELGAVLRELARVESIAQHRGYAIAMGHPHDVTIQALKRWLPNLDARGFALVPLSAVVARRSCADGVVLVANACSHYAAAQSLVQ
jgi:polysaccharide deacetylase 2 family uncharacterized protein YibQ